MSVKKYANRTLEYKLVVVLEDILGKIRYVNVPCPYLTVGQNANIDIPNVFFHYPEEDGGEAVPAFNKFGLNSEDFYEAYESPDGNMKRFLENFLSLGLNNTWAIPIKEVKAAYYEFVYTAPFVFSMDFEDTDLRGKLVDLTTDVDISQLPIVAL